MASAVCLTLRNVPLMKRNIPLLVSRSMSLMVRSPEMLTVPYSSKCGCGSSNGTFSHISYSAALRANKVVGMEYEDGKLIYFGSKSSLVKKIQMALYAVGAAIAVPSPFLWDMIEQEFAKYLLLTWVGLFGIANPVLFYKFSKRYVYELYYDKETSYYTAVVPSIWIFGKTKVVFTSRDCSMPDTPAAFASFLVKKMPLLVSSDNMDYFEYSKMLRYASDLDYENPDRQSQYEETLQDAINEIGSQNAKRKKTSE